MVGWHHQLVGYEFEYALGVGDGQGSLVCRAVHGVTKSRTQLSDQTELKETKREYTENYKTLVKEIKGDIKREILHDPGL